MSQAEFEVKRRKVIAKATGKVLEIGAGSGLNFKYYGANSSKVYALDNNPGMQKLATRRASIAPIAIELVTQSGEQLPFEDESFESVVSSWSLCSIERVEQALREIRRVLKPGGKFIFIEHGLCPDKGKQVWQHRLTPLQKRLAGNCHLDRPIPQLIEGQGLRIETLEEYYLEGIPKLAGYTYEGVASRAW
jgi:ubiquinone/menaquinone biosynthesis C-methylase UbiE